MTAILRHSPGGDGCQRLRADRQAHIRWLALLVTLALHGLAFWWGMSSGRFGVPAQEKIQAICVFLPPLILPEPTAAPRPRLVSPQPVVRSVAAPALVPREAAREPQSVPPPAAASPSAPATPVSSPAPLVELTPEALPSRAGAISVAPLPVAVAASHPSNNAGGAPTLVSTSSARGFAEAEQIAAAPVVPSGGGPTGAGKEPYLRALFAHIEAHKFYPPSARRRQLEGQVRVAFTIEPDGGISDFKVSEGYPQLQEAARQTVRSALPLPLPMAGVTLPFSLSYHMDFRLR